MEEDRYIEAIVEALDANPSECGISEAVFSGWAREPSFYAQQIASASGRHLRIEQEIILDRERGLALRAPRYVFSSKKAA